MINFICIVIFFLSSVVFGYLLLGILFGKLLQKFAIICDNLRVDKIYFDVSL